MKQNSWAVYDNEGREIKTYKTSKAADAQATRMNKKVGAYIYSGNTSLAWREHCKQKYTK